MIKGNIYGLLLAMMCLTLVSTGQDVRPSVEVDSTNFLIGDHIRFQVNVQHEPQVEVAFPLLAGKLGKLEILERSPLDTLTQNGVVSLSQTLILTTFDSGFYQIPSIPIPYTIKGSDSPKEVKTNPINIEVFTVAIDTTSQEIKPIKGPLDDPYRFREALPYVLLVVLIGLIVLGVWLYRKYFKKDTPEAQAPVRPKVPAHITAMNKLAKVEQEKLWQQGMVKKYYSELSFIVREYIEGRYNMLALESTTDEILSGIGTKNLKEGSVNILRDLLETSDLAKFAKFKPGPQESMKALDVARTFVKQTKEESGVREQVSGQEQPGVGTVRQAVEEPSDVETNRQEASLPIPREKPEDEGMKNKE